MASALKRKRGTVEVLDRSKRSKSTKTNSDGQLPIIGDKVGWEAAFAAPAIMQELVQTNGINGHGINSPEDSEDAVDFESFLEEEEKEKQAERDGAAEKALRKALRKKEAQAWKISEPIAGRMINNDPVFTADEKYAS
jgi:post-segregation antitoxin (ccd killing protein)